MKAGLLLAMILALPSCASAPHVPSDASPHSIDLLRDCATVTESCAGLASLQINAPELCTMTADGTVCAARSPGRPVGNSSRSQGVTYIEVLAAMETPAGICALNAVHSDARAFGPGEFAILGIWASNNGTSQYLKAQYLPDPAALKAVSSPRDFSAACQQLSGLI